MRKYRHVVLTSFDGMAGCMNYKVNVLFLLSDYLLVGHQQPPERNTSDWCSHHLYGTHICCRGTHTHIHCTKPEANSKVKMNAEKARRSDPHMLYKDTVQNILKSILFLKGVIRALTSSYALRADLMFWFSTVERTTVGDTFLQRSAFRIAWCQRRPSNHKRTIS